MAKAIADRIAACLILMSSLRQAVYATLAAFRIGPNYLYIQKKEYNDVCGS
jgi:hypothetical protein